MGILICNAGSSSLKFSLFEAGRETLLADGGVDWGTHPARLVVRSASTAETRKEVHLQNHAAAIIQILDELRVRSVHSGIQELQAVGHRVVHGGERFNAAVQITPDVLSEIESLSELAPLHNPPSLEVIRAVMRLLPETPQMAAFDTAFHATLSEAARTYPIPRQWTREWGIRRYGFHGLSHAYCAARAAEVIGRDRLRVIIAHLGNGASMSAVRDGICVDTSMGYTPLEGLMMGTRSGTVDPGLMLHILRQKGLTASALDHALNFESGLLGVSGVSADMRDVLGAMESNPDARLAVDVYVHRVRQCIGAMAATLGGVDALVFTAGVGENAPHIREQVCQNLGHLGLGLDGAKNQSPEPDSDIAASSSSARILVIATREDLTILREIRRLLETNIHREPAINSTQS